MQFSRVVRLNRLKFRIKSLKKTSFWSNCTVNYYYKRMIKSRNTYKNDYIIELLNTRKIGISMYNKNEKQKESTFITLIENRKFLNRGHF